MTDRIYLQPATGAYSDWTGTAYAENSMVKGSNDLYKMAGLDHSRWSIIAVDAFAYSHGAEPAWTVSVYAFDREASDVDSHDDLLHLHSQDGRGSVPVTEVRLHDVSLDDVIKSMKTLHVQLTTPKFPRMDIVGHTDHPPQSSPRD